METMGRKKPRPRRSFTREFKAEIVELCQFGDRSAGQVVRGFQLDRDGGARVGGYADAVIAPTPDSVAWLSTTALRTGPDARSSQSDRPPPTRHPVC